MPLVEREVCKFCEKGVIPEKMGVIACRNCFPKSGGVDFKNQAEKNAYYAEKARRERVKKLPQVCPRCEEPKLDTRSWVVREDGLVVCRTCNYQINLLKGVRMEAAFDKAFIAVHTTRYVIDGAALRAARQSIGIAMRGMADKCGWGSTYQFELECGDNLSISEKAYLKLIAAFEELKEIPDYDEEIAALIKKQKEAKELYGKKMGIQNRAAKYDRA